MTETTATSDTTEAAPATEESPVRAPLPTATFVTSVARVEDLGHPFRRITVRGGDLHRFRSVGPDQFVYLLLPPTGRDELTIDASFGWDAYRAMPEADRPVGAYYTVRHHRPTAAEIDIDVVIHDAPGVASDWAKRAAPRNPVALWGPRTAYAPPEGARHQLLLGDETALPAIGAILETFEGRGSATVLLELDPRTALTLPLVSGVEVVRIDRESGHGAPAALPAALRETAISPATYVWGGGEFEVMNEIRRELRAERGLPAANVSVVGYWRTSTEA